MTLSLVHYNPFTGTSASICATGGVSVGGYVNHSWRGVGACATQGLLTNPWYASSSKKLLEQGLTAEQVVAKVKKEDSGHAKRQCVVMDKDGKAAFIHGVENIHYVGSCYLPHTAVAGNMLENNRVLKRFIGVFLECTTDNAITAYELQQPPIYKPNYEDSLPESLIEALAAAIHIGGDKRGVRSASLRVESFTQAPIDIRVDWSRGSIIEDMQEVLRQVRGNEFIQFLNALPHQ